MRPKIEVIVGDGLGTSVPDRVVHKTLLGWGRDRAPRGSSISNAQFQRHRTTTSGHTRSNKKSLYVS